jgi:hypothetical protein
VRSTPRGCFGTLLRRRAVGVAPEGTRSAVTGCCEERGRRSRRGESVTSPSGAASRSIRCIMFVAASVEGMRATLRRLAVCCAVSFAALAVRGLTVSNTHSSSSPLGERSRLADVSDNAILVRGCKARTWSPRSTLDAKPPVVLSGPPTSACARPALATPRPCRHAG